MLAKIIERAAQLKAGESASEEPAASAVTSKKRSPTRDGQDSKQEAPRSRHEDAPQAAREEAAAATPRRSERNGPRDRRETDPWRT